MSNVKVVGITKSLVEGIDTVKDFICYCARVSNPENQMNTLTNDRLIKYLINNKHWSPFEQVTINIEIKSTRDITRQLLRHTFKFQEFSQRYAKVLVNEFELREARVQHPTNRQKSTITDDKDLTTDWYNLQQETYRVAVENYEQALAKGIAKEQARALLPEGLTATTLYAIGDLRLWGFYCQLRSANGTQKEHQIIAQQCANEIEKYLPGFKEFFSVQEEGESH